MESDLEWLPERSDWQEALSFARSLGPSKIAEALSQYRGLANCRMDLTRTVKLDRAVQVSLGRGEDVRTQATGWTRVRLALIGSSTLGHLVPGIRVAGLRHDLLLDVYQGAYGTWRQELADSHSGLHAFRPDIVMIAVDAYHAAELERAGGPGNALNVLRESWSIAREHFGCAVLQQTIMPVLSDVLGHAEHLLPESGAALVERLNAQLASAAATCDGVHLLAVHRLAAQQGLARWHSRGLWFRAKQEVHPAISPLYGDHVGRIVAALLGQSAKCLVLDLDNTLWGGVIGDDGLDGIVVGTGSPLGEAHLQLQNYALALRERGIVLAVCSKNDESNARLPFQQHRAMALRDKDFACFVANWRDKATNLRHIANELNIGLDALVFVDDNPVERGLIRRELPEVRVPEMPEDPAEYVSRLAAAGYFESLGITGEDRLRGTLYRETTRRNKHLAAAKSGGASSLDSYLASLNMELEARAFDARDRARIVQLINKTNQFNLTTRRVLDSDIDRVAADPSAVTLQLRLRDVYGEQGIVAVVVGEKTAHSPFRPERIGPLDMPPTHSTDLNFPGGELLITHWLMSCRVLGRQVEHATLNLLVERARHQGFRKLLGLYIPTAKNGMVRDLYRQLGFNRIHEAADGSSAWALDISAYKPWDAHIDVHGEALELQCQI